MTSKYVKLTKEEIKKLIAMHSEREEIDILIEEICELTKEMSDLAKALIKQRRRRNGVVPEHSITPQICEEFVHVYISMAVLQQIIENEDVRVGGNKLEQMLQENADRKAKEIRELIK
jgi:hypothetical protein